MGTVLDPMSTLLYEQIAQEIESQVLAGVLVHGDKLPSVRAMSTTRQVGINTVLNAYVLLESKGVIESRPQSGFYVNAKRVAPVTMSPKVSSTPKLVRTPDLVADLFDVVRNPSIVPLGAACLSPEFYPNKAITRLMRKVIREEELHSAHYELPPGNLKLRTQIAKRMARAGCRVSPHEIVITCGALDAVQLSLRSLLSAGDTVLIETPNYFGILQILESLRVKVIEVPADPRTGIDIDSVGKGLRQHKVKAALLMSNFNNPLGSLVPDEGKKELVRLSSKYGVPLVEDDLYGDLSFDGTRPKPLKAFDEEGLVLSCASCSKTISPGFRLGWVHAGKFQRQVEILQLGTTMGATSLPQKVLAEYLASGSYDRHLRRLRQHFAAQIHRVQQAVLQYFPSPQRVSQPQGGYVLWVQLPKEIDAVELRHLAIQKGSSISPGTIFSASGQFRTYIRLNCANTWSPVLEKSIRTLGELSYDLLKLCR